MWKSELDLRHARPSQMYGFCCAGKILTSPKSLASWPFYLMDSRKYNIFFYWRLKTKTTINLLSSSLATREWFPAVLSESERTGTRRTGTAGPQGTFTLFIINTIIILFLYYYCTIINTATATTTTRESLIIKLIVDLWFTYLYWHTT